MALDFFAGCIGGCAGVLIGHPLDTVKVRLQTQDFRNPLYKGTWHCLTSIIKKEKFSGLYKGVTSPLGGVAVVNAIVFGVYGNVQRSLGSDGLGSLVIAGAAAGLSQSFICSPMELVKSRLQLQEKKIYKGAMDCFVKVYKSEGIKGLYKGMSLCMLREVPAFGTYFLTYELMAGGENIPTWKMLLAGGVAGSVSWLIVYPVDIVKTCIQSDGINGPPKYQSAMHCLRTNLKLQGHSFLMRGLSSTIIRAFPTNAVTFTVVNWTMRFGDYVNRKIKPEEKILKESPLNGFIRIFKQEEEVLLI